MRDKCERRRFCVSAAHSTYVKGEKSEPKDDGSERGQGHVVTRNVDGDFLTRSIRDELASSGTQKVRRRSCGHASDHVDSSTTGKVIDLAIQQATGVPDPV